MIFALRIIKISKPTLVPCYSVDSVVKSSKTKDGNHGSHGKRRLAFQLKHYRISSMNVLKILILSYTFACAFFLPVSAQWVKQTVSTTAGLRGLSVVNEKV